MCAFSARQTININKAFNILAKHMNKRGGISWYLNNSINERHVGITNNVQNQNTKGKKHTFFSALHCICINVSIITLKYKLLHASPCSDKKVKCNVQKLKTLNSILYFKYENKKMEMIFTLSEKSNLRRLHFRSRDDEMVSVIACQALFFYYFISIALPTISYNLYDRIHFLQIL